MRVWALPAVGKNFVINPKIWDATGTSFGAYAGSVLTSPAAMMAGMMMGASGLMGSHRGTWGVAMGTAGGALVGAGIGAQFGGPMGAALGAGIGAVAGFGIGLGEKLFGVETPENQAKRESCRVLVLRMTGQKRAVPRRLSRRRCRRDARGLPVKYAFGSRRSMTAARGASSASSVRLVRSSYRYQTRRTGIDVASPRTRASNSVVGTASNMRFRIRRSKSS
jgi:hypothetical protein